MDMGHLEEVFRGEDLREEDHQAEDSVEAHLVGEAEDVEVAEDVVGLVEDVVGLV